MSSLKENTDKSLEYSVGLTKETAIFFEDASAKLQQRLDNCFEQLKKTPYIHANIKSLKGELKGYYRYRVGDYRVVYQIDEEKKQVIIITIAHRQKVYKK